MKRAYSSSAAKAAAPLGVACFSETRVSANLGRRKTADEDPGDEFLELHASRDVDEFVRFEIRGSHNPTSPNEWGRFNVPIDLLPQLPKLFTLICERMRSEGMLGVETEYFHKRAVFIGDDLQPLPAQVG